MDNATRLNIGSEPYFRELRLRAAANGWCVYSEERNRLSGLLRNAPRNSQKGIIDAMGRLERLEERAIVHSRNTVALVGRYGARFSIRDMAGEAIRD